MTNIEQKDLILAYHNNGLSYQEIADKFGVTNEYARTVCSRKKRARNKSSAESDGKCVYCGKDLDLSGNRRARLFCDEKCRKRYYNQKNMRKPYICKCVQCGQEFVAYGYSDKRYCSRECQSVARRNNERSDR